MRCGTLSLILLLAVTFPAQAAAPAPQTDSASSSEALLPDPQAMARVTASVDRALQYLAQVQRPDGSWPCSFGDNDGINAFCLLAFMGRGHVPGRGPYRVIVDRAINHLLSTQQPNGLFKSPNASHGPMYEHAMATVALVEAHGFIPSLQLRNALQRAVDVIIKSQKADGGWRYQPAPTGKSDLSVTVMQVVALSAALNARLNVPKETMDKAYKYVQRCAVPQGGFAYQPGGGAGDARTAAGILSMVLLGHFDDPSVRKGLDWLYKRPYSEHVSQFWYMNYYAMQAQFQAGGKYWDHWQRQTREFLLEHQNSDGSWPGYGGKGINGPAKCYSTAIGAMTMEVYMHYLPVYQR